jgi:uncharacterized protein YndB with AHSA1/START domain
MTPDAMFNPETDLQIDRLIAAHPETIWRCWAEPALFKQWFTPHPVEVTEVDNDLRAGGRAFNVMRLPDGTEFRNEGCFLVADPAKRLVFTDAMQSGFRPAATPFMTCDLRLTPQANGTLYTCHVMHPTPEDRARHEEMGFFDGWGTTLEQLDALARSL